MMAVGLSIAVNKRLTEVVLLVLMLTGAGIAGADNKPIVFQSTDTPPYWSANLPDNGLGGAILKLVSEAAKVDYSIEYLPVKRFRKSLFPYIVGDPELLIHSKRRAIFPIGLFRAAFFYYKAKHDVIRLNSPKDLRGYTLGVLRGTLEDKDYFDKYGINVEESDTLESLLRKLKKGRIDFCILVRGTGEYTIQQLFPEETAAFAQTTIPGSFRPLAMMIDLSNPEGQAAAQRYRRVLERVLHSPEYRQIIENFYGKNNIPGDFFEQLNKFLKYYASTWDN